MVETDTGRSNNEYERDNPYEDDHADIEKNGRTLTLASSSLRVADNWSARNVAPATAYQPVLGETRRNRRKAERLQDDFATATTVAEAGTRFNQALVRQEASAQELEQTQQHRRLIPLKIEQEKFEIGKDILNAQTDFEAALDQQEKARVDRQRHDRIDADNFEIARLRKEAEQVELRARIAAANAQLRYADEIGKRRAEAELHKADGEALRQEADAAVHRHHRDRQRAPIEGDDIPDDLRAPLATARRVAQAQEWADRKVAEIRQRAEAEGRPLTPDELEEIDQIRDAAASGEDTIRRSSASDMP